MDEVIRRIVCALAHATVSTFAAIRSTHLSASTASASCGIRVREGINITPYNTERNCYSSKDTYQYQNHQEPNDEGSIRKHTNHHAARVVLEPKELLAQKATRESILSIYLRSINKCFPPLVCWFFKNTETRWRLSMLEWSSFCSRYLQAIHCCYFSLFQLR